MTRSVLPEFVPLPDLICDGGLRAGENYREIWHRAFELDLNTDIPYSTAKGFGDHEALSPA